MATITGQRLSNLAMLAIGTTGTLFYAESASTNSFKMSEIGIYNTLYKLQLSGNFQPKNEDWRFVHMTGNESITGNKAFVNDISANAMSMTYLYAAYLQGNSAPNSYISLNNDELIAEDEVTALNWNNRTLIDNLNTVSINWNNRTLTGLWNVQGLKLVLSGTAPSTPTSVGVSGQVATTGQKLFICTGTNKWGYLNITPW